MKLIANHKQLHKLSMFALNIFDYILIVTGDFINEAYL